MSSFKSTYQVFGNPTEGCHNPHLVLLDALTRNDDLEEDDDDDSVPSLPMDSLESRLYNDRLLPPDTLVAVLLLLALPNPPPPRDDSVPV